jgi:hypothetical protein
MIDLSSPSLCLLSLCLCLSLSCQRSSEDELDPFPGCGVTTLLKLLKSESDATNLQLLVWSISCLPLFHPGWTDVDQRARIDLIATSVLLLKAPEVAYDVKAVILRMLADLPSLYESSPRHLHPIELAVTILNGLCAFISSATSCDPIPPPISSPPSLRSPAPIKSPTKPRTVPQRGSGNEQSPYQRRRSFVLIDSAFLAIFEWLCRVLDHHLVTNRSGQMVMNKIQETSVSFLQYLSSSYFPSQTTNFIEKALCSNAFRIVDHLLSRAGQYPMRPTGSASHECHIYDYIDGKKEGRCRHRPFEGEDQFCHYLIDNDLILSIGEISRSPPLSASPPQQVRNTALLVIARNQNGKYIHELSSLSSLESLSPRLEITPRPQETSVREAFTQKDDGLMSAIRVAKAKGDLLMSADSHHDWIFCSGDHPNPLLSFQSVQKDLSSPLDISSSWFNPFVRRLREQEQRERSLDHPFLPSPLSPLPLLESSERVALSPAAPPHSINLFIKARQFLSQNRFLSSSCHGQVLRIVNNRNLLEKLHALDDCPTRDQLEVWVAYARNEIDHSDTGEPQQRIELLTAGGGGGHDPNYVRFLRGLGWLVDLADHTGCSPFLSSLLTLCLCIAPGFNAEIDPSLFAGQLLYHASPLEEIVFHQHVWPLASKSPEHALPATLSRDRIRVDHSHQNLKLGLSPSVLILWNRCSQQVGCPPPLPSSQPTRCTPTLRSGRPMDWLRSRS